MAVRFPRSVLITGTNRGIGHELVRQILSAEEPPEHVFATHRSPLGTQGNEALEKLAKENASLHLVQLDVGDESSISRSVSAVRSVVGDAGLNVLINNSGVCQMTTKLNDLGASEMMDTYRVNSVGPVLMTRAMLPLLTQAAQVNGEKTLGWERAAVVHISSSSGSIATKETDPWKIYSYKASKAALNMLGTLMCAELTPLGIVSLLLCPGWVRTDMGTSVADIAVEESVEGILNVVAKLDSSCNGKYVNYRGVPLPW